MQLQVNRANSLLNGYVLEGAGETLVHSAADYENFLAPPPELADRKLRAELGAVLVGGPACRAAPRPFAPSGQAVRALLAYEGHFSRGRSSRLPF